MTTSVSNLASHFCIERRDIYDDTITVDGIQYREDFCRGD